jgi:hypothetical protein
MVSKMALLGSKRQMPPWSQESILYLGIKYMLYYTISTIGDNRSRKKRPKGPSFLLIKSLGGVVSCGTRAT